MTGVTVPVDTESSVTVVTVEGEFDASNFGRVEETLKTYFLGELGSALVVDVSGVTFVDSTALRVLVRASREAINLGVEFRVAGAHGQVARVIEMTGLRDILNVDGAESG